MWREPTWRQAHGPRCKGGGEERERRRQGGGAEDLGRVALHEAALAKDAEAEGQDDNAQEAHKQVARAHHPLPLWGMLPHQHSRRSRAWHHFQATYT